MKLIYKTKIVDRNWRIYLWQPEEFHNKFYKEFGAVYGLTHFHRRAIDLLVTADPEDIRHELWHAYTYELCLRAAPIKKAGWDEIMCDFFAKYGKLYLKQCSQLTKEFTKIKRRFNRT